VDEGTFKPPDLDPALPLMRRLLNFLPVYTFAFTRFNVLHVQV